VTRGQLLRKQARGLPLLEEDATIVLERQALHASRISFVHPLTGQTLELSAPLANDIAAALAVLREGK
jgi:23S rRNA pseudouridine1911/1915/1917 synthase